MGTFKDYAIDAGLIAADYIIDQNPISRMINKFRGKPQGFINVKENARTRLGENWEQAAGMLAPIQDKGISMALNAVAPGAGSLYSAQVSTAEQVGGGIQEKQSIVDEYKSQAQRRRMGLVAEGGLNIPARYSSLGSYGSAATSFKNPYTYEPLPSYKHEPLWFVPPIQNQQFSQIDETIPEQALVEETKKRFGIDQFAFGLIDQPKEGTAGYPQRYERNINTLANLQGIGAGIGMIGNLGVLGAFNKMRYSPAAGYSTVDMPNIKVPYEAMQSSKNQYISKLYASAVRESRERGRPFDVSPILGAENEINIQRSNEMASLFNEAQKLIASVQYQNAILAKERRDEINQAILENQRRKAMVLSGLSSTISGTIGQILNTQTSAAVANSANAPDISGI